MKKARWSLLAISLTGLIALMLILKPEESPVEARFVTVQRGDVHQVVAITGRLAYADEELIYAKTVGNVSQICVKDGDRVGAGEALIRVDSSLQEDVLSAFLSSAEALEQFSAESAIQQQFSVDHVVIRAEKACTVRQVFVSADTTLAVGTPVARVSSHQQEIVCNAAPIDADKIEPGMWAWISSGGKALGFAGVKSIGNEAADPLTGLTYVEVILQPDQHIDLPEGGTVDVDIYLAGSDDVASIPVEAVTKRDTVWWVNEGRCTEIPAEIVMTDEMLAWVNLPEGISLAIGEFVEGQRIVEAKE